MIVRALLRLHGPRAWFVLTVVTLAFLVGVPILHAGVPPESPLHVPAHVVPLLGRFACHAMAALAVDLVWGYAGILSLGHGVFFALGGYAMGMYLMLSIGDAGVYRSHLPDFMVFLDWKALPWFWRGFDDLAYALVMIVLVPGVLAFVLGAFMFRARIRGVYLSILTQALSFALMLLFFRNETGLGGNNGLTDFKVIHGYPLRDGSTKLALYMISVAALLGIYLVCRALVSGRFGVVLRAIRDAESKARFSGYDTLRFKLFAWTVSAMICGVAGALYVPQVGIINPSELHPSASIEMVIWVAVGGRGTLHGAVLGAFVVHATKSWFTVAAPEQWLFVLGGLFVGVTLFLPEGLVGRWRRRG